MYGNIYLSKSHKSYAYSKGVKSYPQKGLVWVQAGATPESKMILAFIRLKHGFDFKPAPSLFQLRLDIYSILVYLVYNMFRFGNRSTFK